MSNGESERKRIQTLFLHPVEFYHLSEAARLLQMTPAALRREAESDRREAYRSGGRWRFAWRQVACIAFRTWTLAEIHDALGVDAAKVLPPLLALRDVNLQLPEYLLRGMEIAAQNDRTTLDAWLSQEMVDWAGTVADSMECRIPGFCDAYFYPGQK